MNPIFLAFILAVLPWSFAHSQRTIKSLLEPGTSHNAILGLDAANQVRAFYVQNKFTNAWTDERDTQELLNAVRTIDGDGLSPEDYNLSFLERLLLDRDQDAIAVRDLAFTDAFMELAHDLHEGRLNPEALFPGDWEACRQPADYPGLLNWALKDIGICETLQLMKPADNSYEGLKYMLSNFREIKSLGGFPQISFGPAITPGGTDVRMVSIRKRLAMLEFIPQALDNEDVKYDSLLIFAVQRFQRLHGLLADGVIGRRTQQTLALSIDNYIESTLVNLERYRWHQSQLGERCIMVNIPAAELTFSENEVNEFSMKAIIGRPDRRTPVLSSSLTSITINPTWTIPPTILKEDVLPALKTDPTYLDRHDIRVIDNWGREVNSDSIDWTSLNEGGPYIFREDPGPRNPLGLIKFTFPNVHTVYLHDTNSPSLFASPERTLSSGCIRIEAPMKLLRVLLPATGWTEEMVRDQIALGETKQLFIKHPIPIHIVYFTSYVRNNEFYMLQDPYRYDRTVLNALRRSEQPQPPAN